jgi:hypothetical protein
MDRVSTGLPRPVADASAAYLIALAAFMADS